MCKGKPRSECKSSDCVWVSYVRNGKAVEYCRSRPGGRKKTSECKGRERKVCVDNCQWVEGKQRRYCRSKPKSAVRASARMSDEAALKRKGIARLLYKTVLPMEVADMIAEFVPGSPRQQYVELEKFARQEAKRKGVRVADIDRGMTAIILAASSVEAVRRCVSATTMRRLDSSLGRAGVDAYFTAMAASIFDDAAEVFSGRVGYPSPSAGGNMLLLRRRGGKRRWAIPAGRLFECVQRTNKGLYGDMLKVISRMKKLYI